MRVGSLFSGGGLGDLGLEMAGMEIAFQVEIDEYCQEILRLRWPNVPKWRDIRTVRGDELPAVDMLAGGFPCQPVSVAGNRKGDADARWLWPEYYRLICEVMPRWVLVENVPGLLSAKSGRLFGEILRDLATSGYTAEWDCISASALGAPHKRDRVWIVAHAVCGGSKEGKTKYKGEPIADGCGVTVADAESRKNNERERGNVEEANGGGESGDASTRTRGQTLADAKGERCEEGGKFQRDVPAKWPAGGRQTGNVSHSIFAGRQGYERGVLEIENERRRNSDPSGSGWWATEPPVGRVVDGCPRRVDRLKLLGNGQVVPLVAWIGRKIMEYES